MDRLFRRLFPLVVLGLACGLGPLTAQEPSVVAPIMKLLKSGKVPPARLGTIVEMVCQRGGAEDLQFVYEQALQPDAYPAPLRLKALDLLAEAAINRKVQPTGDLAGIALLAAPESTGDAKLKSAAVRLAALWKVAAAAATLQKIARDPQGDESLKLAAIDGLAAIGGKESIATLAELGASAPTNRLKFQAVGALALLDLNAAAALATNVLAAATPQDDPGPLLESFFNRQGGPDKLAAALGKAKLTADVAKRSLRFMYSVGRSDKALSDVLSTAAGIATDPPAPTPEEIKQISAAVAAQGDPVRGEKIFRRADLSCMKCHAVSRAGGQVGPDLSAVGSTSPIEYVVTSILLPDQAIKEQFLTKIIVTDNGGIYTGIVVDRDNQRVILKDANGKEVKIPVASIEEEAEGKSLMPKGLTKFLTKDELLDLSRFIAELGKPGPYAIRSVPTMQRWRLLKPVPKDLATEVPNVELVRAHILDARPEGFVPVYSQVGGGLPLAELSDAGVGVAYLVGEFSVTVAGQIGFELAAPAGAQMWVDAEPFEAQRSVQREFEAGKHKVTIRVDLAGSPTGELKLTLVKPSGSSAQFEPVAGQ